MSASDNWSEYWENEGAGGEVFVNQSGKKHQALSQFWKQHLGSISEHCKLVDLASGAGSIFSELELPATCELHAADISAQALEQLHKRMPKVITHVSSAEQLPFKDAEFDVVVSQFGLEYAGEGAFIEATRIVKKGGRFVALCHIEDGYIDSRNKAELQGAELIKSSNFISLCLEVSKALFTGQKELIEPAVAQFTQVEPLIADYSVKCPTGVHVHLYNGFKQLVNKLSAYAEADVINWLDGMEREVDKAILRLSEMRKAASSEQRLVTIKQQIEKMDGVTSMSFQPFVLPEHSLPVAWQVSIFK